MSEFSTIVVVVILAVVSPIVASRIRIPGVVTEVLLGMMLGALIFLAHRFRGIELLTIEQDGAFAFLAETGFILLLFLVGLEVDFNRIEAQGPRPLLIGAALYAMTLIISYWLVVVTFGLPFILVLALATTAVDVVLPTMREIGMHESALGQNVMLSATIADFTTISILTIYLITLGGEGSGFDAAYLLLPMLLIIFWIAYRLGGNLIWRFPEFLSRFFKSEDPTEMGVRTSLALMFVFVALSSAFGVEAIFGAFFAGVLISALFREGALLEQKLYGVGYGFFVPIFFISVGMAFEFGAVADFSSLSVFPKLLLAALAVKILPSLIFLPRYGLRRTIAIGFLMSARLSFMIAVGSVARALGLIDSGTYASIILMAVLLSVAGPSIFRLIMGRHAEPTDETRATGGAAA